QVLDGIQAVLSELDASWADVADLSVTVPCPCASDGTIIEATNLGTPETKRLWQVPFGELLAAAAKECSGREISVFACNDANAAGQDDDFTRFGNSVHQRTSVFITTGTGLGGCVMINGAIHFGRGQAGELGHVKPSVPAQYAERFAQDANPACGCNGRQCAESRASLKGLIRRVEWALSPEGSAFIQADLEARGQRCNPEVVAELRELAQNNPQHAAYKVRTFADGGQDAFCRWLLEDWAIMIGALFASIAPVLHPNLFIIGGGLTEMSEPTKDWFIGVARKVYGETNAQTCFASAENNCEIVWSVSEDQGWRGGVLMSNRAREQQTK
ncbi:MAG: ROK family protein, partial [Planctomycetales bacterium]